MNKQHYYNMFVDACGRAVRDLMLQFKDEYFKSLKGEAVYCPYTGELLTVNNSTAEYIAPQTLESIVRKFVTKNKIDFEHAAYGINSFNMQIFTDKTLIDTWERYHWKYAKMRLIADTDAVSYEPNDRALEYRQQIRESMFALGYKVATK
jgi:predicted N-acyltransferase